MTYYLQCRQTRDRWGREQHGNEGWESLDGDYPTVAEAQGGVAELTAIGVDAGTDWSALEYRILEHGTNEVQ